MTEMSDTKESSISRAISQVGSIDFGNWLDMEIEIKGRNIQELSEVLSLDCYIEGDATELTEEGNIKNTVWEDKLEVTFRYVECEMVSR